tara:strand:- start:338 stop:613 length:276 start_codon:yes stop_codon:yes gene_type:complete
MKSAYELAMERLSKDAPIEKLTDEQKKEIAELNSQLQAKIAELEIAFNGKIEAAREQEDFNGVEILQQEMAGEKSKIEARFEDKKNAVRGT